MSAAPTPEEVLDVAPTQRKLGRYHLRYTLAHGGMASVYLGESVLPEGFRKWVAIKVIHPHLASNPAFAQMFLNEARLAARLDHPNLCSVFDFGAADGAHFLAMEYLHGEPLSAIVHALWPSPGVPLVVAARVIADIAGGLHAAHSLRRADGQHAEVVHRDVSPQNVFVLYSGAAKLVDFGIARSNEFLGERTETGAFRGKLAYMAPEQAQGFPLDRRADIFSLGIVLWELTTGQRLFRGANEAETLANVLAKDVPRPSTFRTDYPRLLEAVVMRALERNKEERYDTAAEMARDLEHYLVSTGLPSSSAEVAEMMRARFAQRIVAREELLRHGRVEAGSRGAPTVVASELRTATGTQPVTAPLPPRERAGDMGWRAARSIAWLGGAAALLAIGAGASTALRGSPQSPPSPSGATHDTAGPTSPASTSASPVESSSGTAVEPPSAPSSAGQGEPPIASASSGTPSPAKPARARAQARPVRATSGSAGDDTTGLLNLVAIPSAAVYEGGTFLGFTPLAERKMSAGTHVLRLVPTDGQPQRTVTVPIRPRETYVTSVRWP